MSFSQLSGRVSSLVVYPAWCNYMALISLVIDFFYYYFISCKASLLSVRKEVNGHKYMWVSPYVRSRTGRLLLERLAENDSQELETEKTSVSFFMVFCDC